MQLRDSNTQNLHVPAAQTTTMTWAWRRWCAKPTCQVGLVFQAVLSWGLAHALGAVQPGQLDALSGSCMRCPVWVQVLRVCFGFEGTCAPAHQGLSFHTLLHTRRCPRRHHRALSGSGSGGRAPPLPCGRQPGAVWCRGGAAPAGG